MIKNTIIEKEASDNHG